MKQSIVWTFALSLLTTYAMAQDTYYTRKASISFYSKALFEIIEAQNKDVTGFIDTKKAEVTFTALIKNFHFENALMEEHFNSNYMESDKYPKATFSGKIQNPEVITPGVDGTYPVTVEGTLEMHGVSRSLVTTATVTIRNGVLYGNAKFNIYLADYNIKIPTLLSQNIAESVEVTINCQYNLYVK